MSAISSVDSAALHAKPAVDLNIAAEANRILYVLNKIILRAKFLGALQNCIREDGLLQSVLDPNTYVSLLEACDKYTSTYSEKPKYPAPLLDTYTDSLSQNSRSESNAISDKYLREDNMDDSSDYTSAADSKSDAEESSRSDRNDKDLSKVIYLLEDNPEVQSLLKSQEEKQLSPGMRNFLKNMIQFRDKMISQLSENSTQYKNKEKYLRETFVKNELAKEKIERLEEEFVMTKTDANVCLIGRHILINRHQNKLENIVKNSMEAIDKRVNESEKAMVNDWKESLIQQEKLKQDFNQASEKYANMLKDNLAAEKVLRSKRAKIENQVLGWIQKFDQEIGEKQAEEEEIQSLLDRETREVNEIQAKLDEQEEEYDELMQEKAEYEEEMLDRRLYQFVVNRSARRIQRTYRTYKARKLAKKLAKKGKKGKKGKKAEG